MTHRPRLLPLVVPLLTVVGSFTTASTASAGWDNVFQVCCHDCRAKSRTSYYTAEPTPEQREVRYEQRCYYEPVTVMKPERYTEEVPVKVRSYYWDPVTTYTRSSYYDSCSGQCQDICVPRTSYVRKEQCNTVMKYVERIRMVPTQVNRKVCETRPVVTYYGPVTKRYENCDSCELPSTGSAPKVDEYRQNPPSVLPEASGNNIPQQSLPTTPNSRSRYAPLPAQPTYTGKVNARTTSRSIPSTIRGEIVTNDQLTPRPGAKLVFVNASNLSTREYTTADAFGNFDTKLPAGEWFVYVGNGDGRASYLRKITIGEYEVRQFTVVSR